MVLLELSTAGRAGGWGLGRTQHGVCRKIVAQRCLGEFVRTKLFLKGVHRCFAIRLGIRPKGESGQVESAGEGLRPRRDGELGVG